MAHPWPDLKFWGSGEYQVIEENLKDLTSKKIQFCPAKRDMFAALKAVPYEKVKVVVLGQDPYPNPLYSTGLAFSVPAGITNFPLTLKTLFNEYVTDLHYSYPSCGDLSPWCRQGVLLWNVVPSCQAGRSLSHHWPEWEQLTKEILEKVVERNVVIAALGFTARQHLRYIKEGDCPVIETGHPSPRGDNSSQSPFTGSRLFSTINGALTKQGLDPVDWKLP